MSDVKATEHQTVLLEEAVTALNVKPDGVYVDGTYGRGGHSRMILSQLAQDGHLLMMDKDPSAIKDAKALFGTDERTYIYSGSFTEIDQALQQTGWLKAADGILLDLGVSSPQLDDAERGFSFKHDGPLDMRMDPESGMSAAEWLATAKESEIVKVLFEYGEERFARRIAKAIIQKRTELPIQTTSQLSTIVAAANPAHERNKDPATRTFQAIRIFINRELDDLTACLERSLECLAPGGRLVVISFHSLEDRIVKRFMRDQSQGDIYPPDLPIAHISLNQNMKIISKPVKPSKREVGMNSRSRSAIMRVAEKLK